MSGESSFSAGRRWGILLSVVVSMAAVVALVFMANYLSVLYPYRMNWNAQMNMKLSQQSIGLARSITNDVKVIIYYDRTDPLYNYIAALLDEYRLVNPRISIRTVDHERDPAAAQQLLAVYKQYLSGGTKNLVIFECNGRIKPYPGKLFGDFAIEELPGEKERQFRERFKAFRGEQVVSAALLGVTSDRVYKAYYLVGHDEHPLDSEDDNGYSKFKGILAKNNIDVTNLSGIYGTNEIPADCSLLVMAGTTKPVPVDELVKVKKYLDEGGHLLALMNVGSIKITNGLDVLLAQWGVEAGRDIVVDPDNTTSKGLDLIVSSFNTNHPLVNPMLTSRLQMITPRSMGVSPGFRETSGSPRVTELAWTSSKALIGTTPAGKPVPVAVAVEKSASGTGGSGRGTTRIVATGDSYFLDCQMLGIANNNEDFAEYAVNWLLDQTQVMAGVGSHPIVDYTVVMTRAQMRTIEWIFLAAMPGGVLLIGLFVWLRRRR